MLRFSENVVHWNCLARREAGLFCTGAILDSEHFDMLLKLIFLIFGRNVSDHVTHKCTKFDPKTMVNVEVIMKNVNLMIFIFLFTLILDHKKLMNHFLIFYL